MTPKEAAIDLIEHYVKRGDSIEDLRKSWMSAHGGSYSASIGGAIFPPECHGGYQEIMTCPKEKIKKVGSDKILVEEVGGKLVNEVFSIYEIFGIIKNGKGLQLSLI